MEPNQQTSVLRTLRSGFAVARPEIDDLQSKVRQEGQFHLPAEKLLDMLLQGLGLPNATYEEGRTIEGDIVVVACFWPPGSNIADPFSITRVASRPATSAREAMQTAEFRAIESIEASMKIKVMDYGYTKVNSLQDRNARLTAELKATENSRQALQRNLKDKDMALRHLSKL